MSGYGMGVFPQHAAKLTSSAVSVEVARERGYVTADTKKGLERYGFSPAQQRPPALVIPLHDVFGEVAGYQLRSDDPRVLEGRTMKYESRLGQKMVLDVPPRVHPHLGDPSRPLLITEGPIKADALVSAGLEAVALLGVWGWRGTNDGAGQVALAAWEQVALKGRQLYLAFDSDVMVKPQVYTAMSRFGAWLKLKGANVAYIYMPADRGQKVGADDYLAAGNSAADLVALATSELRTLPGEPAAPKEPVDTFDDVPHEAGHRVLDDVATLLDRYVAWPMVEQRDAVALWIVHTYLLDVFDSTPRLALLSPEKQCGKTRVLELVELLAHRAELTVSMSAPYMYRAIEDYRPTLLVDEVDTVFGSKQKDEANQAQRGLINAGFREGATVGRMVGEGAAMVPARFAVYAPVAMAGIGDCLPDTVIDRSVVVRMRRRAPGETIQPLRRRRSVTETARLARRIAAWCHRTAEALDGVDPAMPSGITDRPADTWEPLLVVADAAGGDWPARARAACVKLNKVRAEADDSIGGKLLADIRMVFDGADRMSSAALAEKLVGIEESPWGDWRGKPIDARWLARKLKPFGVAPKAVRIGDTTPRGYAAEDFHDVWARYLPPLSATSATSATPLASPVADVADVALTGGGNGQHAARDLIEEAFGPDVTDVDPDDYARSLNPGRGPSPTDEDPW